MTDWPAYPNFNEAEFACRGNDCCGHLASMDDDFMFALQTLRTRLGFPLVITSGYRCPEYNEVVSSTGLKGPHTSGKAVDIAIDRTNAYHLLDEVFGLGFTGIGLKQHGGGRFIHLDMLTEPEHAPRPCVWSYR